ncbi:MAG: ATP-binding protein, partial [Anaerolineae bacterium]
VAFDSTNMALYGAIVQHLSAAFRTIQLRQEAVEASHVRDRLLSTLSHELNTPLNLIADLSEMLLTAESIPSAKQHQDLERILASAKQLHSLIQDVLDLAWSEIGQLELAREPLDLGDVLHVVAGVGRQMAQGKGLGWQTQIPPELPLVYGDRTRLRQVMLNLVSNAIKSTPVGEVTLEAATLEDVVSIAVRDTGPGVTRENQQALFNDPAWPKPTGAQAYEEMGLGLAVCKRLVEMHGGEINVWSLGQEGAGSTFFFTLPVMESSDASHSQAAEMLLPGQTAPPQRETSSTILVVDGDPGFLEMHARVVQAQHPSCRVLRTRDSQQALKMLREQAPDLLLINLATPELDGFGLIRTMQQDPFTRDIPIVVMTEQPLMEKDIAKLNRGVVTLLERGVFNAEETLAHIEAALAQERGLGIETQHLVWKAMAYIHTYYADPISRTDVAQHIGVSEDYLSHCFSEGAGIPFITYINRYRLKQAKALLAVGEQSVTEVAMETGFQSASHFSRLFRR